MFGEPLQLLSSDYIPHHEHDYLLANVSQKTTWSSPAAGILTWLQELSVYRRILHGPTTRKTLLAPHLGITAFTVPRPDEPTKQASIADVFAYPRPPERNSLFVKYREALKWIAELNMKSEAKKQAEETEESGDAMERRRLWEALIAPDENEAWSNLSQATIHPEAELAWRMDKRNTTPDHIPVSTTKT